MTPAAQGLDPVVEDLLVVDDPAGDPAAKIHLPLVDQASEPDRDGLLMPSKGALLAVTQAISRSVMTPVTTDLRKTSPRVMRAM